MIFVTIGSMLPFDRLVRAMDEWAAGHPAEDLFYQIGDGTYEPKRGRFERMIGPAAYRKVMEEADIIVAHAGMGSAISAAEMGKPIVLLSRRADLREHTTDHQLHTARWLRNRDGIFVADTEADLPEKIAEARSAARPGANLSNAAPVAFTDALRSVIVERRKLRGA